jgi:hypothetical protein
MLDLSSAVVLGFVLTGLIALGKTLYDGPNRDRVIVGICFIVSFTTVMLIAASDFAHESVILKIPLDSMNFWSQMVIVLLATGLASAIWKGYKAINGIASSNSKPL